MNAPRPFPFFTGLPLPCILWTQTEGKNGGGLGTRLCPLHASTSPPTCMKPWQLMVILYWMVAKTGRNLEQSKQILVCVQAREAGQYHCLHWGHKYFAWSLVHFAYQWAPALPPSSSLRHQKLTLSTLHSEIFCYANLKHIVYWHYPTTGINSCHTTVCWHQVQSVSTHWVLNWSS